jgi:hypothetical protein
MWTKRGPGKHPTPRAYTIGKVHSLRSIRLLEYREVVMAYWWVNQSKTYQAERSAGIMWAPNRPKRAVGSAIGRP